MNLERKWKWQYKMEERFPTSLRRESYASSLLSKPLTEHARLTNITESGHPPLESPIEEFPAKSLNEFAQFIML
jgi:hypothetical protein